MRLFFMQTIRSNGCEGILHGLANERNVILHYTFVDEIFTKFEMALGLQLQENKVASLAKPKVEVRR